MWWTTKQIFCHSVVLNFKNHFKSLDVDYFLGVRLGLESLQSNLPRRPPPPCRLMPMPMPQLTPAENNLLVMPRLTSAENDPLVMHKTCRPTSVPYKLVCHVIMLSIYYHDCHADFSAGNINCDLYTDGFLPYRLNPARCSVAVLRAQGSRGPAQHEVELLIMIHRWF